jgi:predicted HicB family RNase H-like nuclease
MTPDIDSTGVMDTQREDSRITLRMPAEVAEGMKLSAHENDRSLNGEIVRALREYLAKGKRAK